MSSEPIEFENPDQQSEKSDIVRKSFRVPLEEAENVWFAFQGQRYSVVNISYDGVGILIDHSGIFKGGRTLEKCDLNIADQMVKNLKGSIVHVSCTDDKIWQCGIQWLELPDDKAKLISETVSSMKEQLLKNGTISFESSS